MLEPDDFGHDPILVDLEDAERRGLSLPHVTCHLKPAPFEPTGVLLEPPLHRRRIPLVDSSRVEKQNPFEPAHVSPVCMAEDDHVSIRKPSPQSARQPGVRTKV